MPQYLSDEWITEAGEALAQSTALRAAAAEAEGVVIQYEVSAAPGGKRTYSVGFDAGSVTLAPGPHPDPSATFSLDYDAASAIAGGELSAQAAFMQGRLKLGGDVNVLIRAHALLDELDDALGDLRTRTEF